MKVILKLFKWPVLAIALVSSAASAPLNLKVSAERRKIEVDKQQTESTNESSEKWCYKVLIENKMFKSVEGLEVVYRIFKMDDSRRGVAGKLIPIPGSTAIASLKPGEKFTFNTGAVILNKSSLKPGWVYTDKSKATLEDGVAGIWLRVMKDGEIVFEYMTPTSLKDKAQWE